MTNIQILFEDSDYVAINKPSGLVVHSDGRTEEPSVSDWIKETYNLQGVGEPLRLPNGEILDRPGIVHRIDRDTSGVLIIAKNQEAFLSLKLQFQAHEVEKVYHTFVYGEVKENEGEINRSIGRSPNDFRRWSAQRGARGELRDAVTTFKVLARGLDTSYVAAMPKTGRTHQIRVHLKAINHPVICDTLYAPNLEPLLGFSRLALHAHRIAFRDREGKLVEVTAPFPQDFEHARELLGLRP